MAQVTILGLILTVTAGLASATLLVRAQRRGWPPGVALLAVAVILFDLWMTTFFALSYLRLYVLTAISPVAAIRLTSAVLLALSALSLAWLYVYVVVAYEFLSPRASRRPLLVTTAFAVVVAGFLVVGWLGFLYSGDGTVFLLARDVLGTGLFPAVLGVTVWLSVDARRQTDPHLRAVARAFAAGNIPVFSGLAALWVAWNLLAAVSPVLPLGSYLTLGLIYNLVTVCWVMRAKASRVGAELPPPPP